MIIDHDRVLEAAAFVAALAGVALVAYFLLALAEGHPYPDAQQLERLPSPRD